MARRTGADPIADANADLTNLRAHSETIRKLAKTLGKEIRKLCPIGTARVAVAN